MGELANLGKLIPASANDKGETAAHLKAVKRTICRLAERRDSGFQLEGTWRFRRPELDRRQHQQEEAGGEASLDQASCRITLGEEQGEDHR